jgi:molybdenum cofactor biosynthesis enzyme
MVDITHKIITLRTATAQAIVKVGSPETMKAILDKRVPKGDVLEVARTAAFAVKTLLILFRIATPCQLNIRELTMNFWRIRF